MRKLLASVAAFFILFAGISSGSQVEPEYSSINENEPDIVKKQLLLESAKISDIGMQAAKDMLERAFFENVTEADVVRAIENAMISQGSSEYIEAFGVLVMSGEESALPHGDTSNDETNLILVGEVVVVDLGARYRGYCTDLTRTFFMGEPTDEMKEIYNIIYEAQEAGINAVRAGELARDVDKAAREVIDGYGYGENFTHGLGHGIGVYIHMPPVLSPSSDGVLFQSSDMALTIEPGIYLPARWGIRIEDDVMVTRDGSQLITRFPKDLSDAIIMPEGYINNTGNSSINSSKQTQEMNYFIIIGPLIILGIVIMTALILKKRRK